MIQILNEEYFSIRYEDDNPSKDENIIHLFTEPRNIELKYYAKIPFVSIISRVSSENLYDSNDVLRTELPTIALKKDKSGNSYLPDGKKIVTNIGIPSRSRLPIVYKVLDEDNNDEFHQNANIVIAAIPIKGIIVPIPVSPDYTLYNGTLLVTNQEFEVKGGPFTTCTKLVYLTFELNTTLSFNEYIEPVMKDEYGYCITHTLGFAYNKGKKEIKDTTIINYINYEKNEFLFRPDPTRKLFIKNPNLIYDPKFIHDNKIDEVVEERHTPIHIESENTQLHP